MEVKGGFEEKSFKREEFFIQFNFEHQNNNNSMPLISTKKMLVLVEHTLLIVKRLFTKVFIAL